MILRLSHIPPLSVSFDDTQNKKNNKRQHHLPLRAPFMWTRRDTNIGTQKKRGELSVDNEKCAEQAPIFKVNSTHMQIHVREQMTPI